MDNLARIISNPSFGYVMYAIAGMKLFKDYKNNNNKSLVIFAMTIITMMNVRKNLPLAILVGLTVSNFVSGSGGIIENLSTVSTYEHVPNAALSGHNHKHLTGKTVEQCKAECNAIDWCKSFDYYKGQNRCDLSRLQINVPGLKKNYRNNPYDHYRKLTTEECPAQVTCGSGTKLEDDKCVPNLPSCDNFSGMACRRKDDAECVCSRKR